MIMDLQNLFSNAQAVTADAVSTRVIDLEPNGGPNLTKDIAAGQALYLHILVHTAMVSAGGATLTITIESDDNDTLTTATVHATVVTAVAAATMVAGYWIVRGFALPQGEYQRYLGLRYTTNTSDFQTGNITAWLSENKMDTKTYESGVTTGLN